MLTTNIQPLEDSVLPVCSYHLIGSCLRNSAHHQPPGRNTKPTKYQIEDGGIRPNPVSLYMANIGSSQTALAGKQLRLISGREILSLCTPPPAEAGVMWRVRLGSRVVGGINMSLSLSC
ncbi:hypothetical protein TNCV_1294131 [Trichonephila clavipes]|nr:hypothetical protein TNCV_1294131 [Trichonephila clavipes]